MRRLRSLTLAAAVATGCGGAAPEPTPGRGNRGGENPARVPVVPARDTEPSVSVADDAAASRVEPAFDAGEGEPGAPAPPVFEAAGPAPLPAGTTVLHVGDSFAGALGVELNARLREAGVRSHLSFRTASFLTEWAWQRHLDLELAQHRPDLVLVTLGANETAMLHPEQRAPVVRRLVAKLGSTPCVWIAIPLWGKDNGLMGVIRENCAPCRFLDTNALVRSMPRLHDGVHPTLAARARWARFVVEWLARARNPQGPLPWSLHEAERLPREPRLDFSVAP